MLNSTVYVYIWWPAIYPQETFPTKKIAHLENSSHQIHLLEVLIYTQWKFLITNKNVLASIQSLSFSHGKHWVKFRANHMHYLSHATNDVRKDLLAGPEWQSSPVPCSGCSADWTSDCTALQAREMRYYEMMWSAVYHSEVLVQHIVVQCIAARHSAVQCSEVKCSSVQCSSA